MILLFLIFFFILNIFFFFGVGIVNSLDSPIRNCREKVFFFNVFYVFYVLWFGIRIDYLCGKREKEWEEVKEREKERERKKERKKERKAVRKAKMGVRVGVK